MGRKENREERESSVVRDAAEASQSWWQLVLSSGSDIEGSIQKHLEVKMTGFGESWHEAEAALHSRLV